VVNIVGYKTDPDFPCGELVSKECDFCGVNEPVAFWDGCKPVSICRDCAMNILPALIVDAAFSGKFNGWDHSKGIVRDVNSRLYRAMLHSACSAVSQSKNSR